MKRALTVSAIGTAVLIGSLVVPTSASAIEAPHGYTYGVTSHHHHLPTHRAHGVTYVNVSGHRVYLGVDDAAQGGGSKHGALVAWRTHHAVRVTTDAVYRRHGYVAELDARVQTSGRTLLVVAEATR